MLKNVSLGQHSELSYRAVLVKLDTRVSSVGVMGLTKVYPGHLTHLTALQVLVVVKGALRTGPCLLLTLIR